MSFVLSPWWAIMALSDMSLESCINEGTLDQQTHHRNKSISEKGVEDCRREGDVCNER